MTHIEHLVAFLLAWSSEIIAAIQLMFAIVLWPTLRDRDAAVPRSTSIPTAAGLWVIGLVYAAMELWSAAAMGATTAFAWTFVAVHRPVRRTRPMLGGA